MADIPLKKLVQLIEQSHDDELRLSGIRVAGALCSKKDSFVVQSLLQIVEQSDNSLRASAIDALGNLGAEVALPRLLELVQAGGDEVESCVLAASRLGKKGPKAISKLMADANPHLRRRIAAALGHGHTDNAIQSVIQTLLDSEPRVVEAAARSLSSEVPTLTEKQRQALCQNLIDHLNNGEVSAPCSEEAMLRILGELQMPQAEATFWKILKTASSTSQRAVALEALGSIQWRSTDARLKQLFACAHEKDFTIVSRALMLLQQVEPKGKAQQYFEEMLTAPDLAAKRLAISKLGEADSIAVARALVPLLKHSHRGLQNDALRVLQSSSKGRQALIESLLKAENTDDAWSMARALKPATEQITAAQRKQILTGAFEHQDAELDRAKAFWFLLRAIDPEQANLEIEERARDLRKKKKYEQALSYCRILTRDPTCGPETRFEQAGLCLKLSDKDTAEVARQSDPCLDQFVRLHHNSSFDLLDAIGKAKWLDDEDLFYLGFHFASDLHKPARDFGRDILQIVIKRSPRTKIGKNARSKLKTEGLLQK